MKRLLFLLAAVVPGAIAVACADDQSPATSAPAPSSTVPPMDAAVVTDADAGDPDSGCQNAAGCVVTTDCTLVDFCSQTFPVSTSIGLNAIWGSSATDVWAVGTRGTVLHNSGTSFAPVDSGSTDIFFAVWGTGPTDVWAIDSTSPRHSTGGAFTAVQGSTWNPSQAGTGRLWTGYSASKDDVWIAGELTARFVKNFGDQNSFWRLGPDNDGGVQWNPAPSCSSQEQCTPAVRSLWGAGGTALAVGMKGQAFRLDDADAGHWAFENPQTGNDLEAVWGGGATDLWAVGQSGTIRHATSADAWTITESPTTSDLHAVWGSGPSDVWAVGDAGTIVHFDGKTWAIATLGLLPGGAPTALRGIWGSGPDDVWIVGEGILLHRTAQSRRHP